MKPRLVTRLIGLSFLLFTGLVSVVVAELPKGRGRVPFWLELRANQQMDPQLLNILTDDAYAVVLRARLEDARPRYSLEGLTERLHKSSPSTPLLLYTWASRYLPKNRSGGEIMRWLGDEPHLLVRSRTGSPMESFGDVTNTEYREKAIAAITKAVSATGVDGVAVDLAIRTPVVRPKPLAARCADDPVFCSSYADGMDALFQELQSALGRRFVIYNGLWNFNSGSLVDQARLLRNADAAIVEYFGMNPREGQHSFTNDVLPYLQVMSALPKGKKVFIYGRGPWHYTDYEEDYLWQRYLYGAYLLGASDSTYFKYHASFQVPEHAGRTGGLAVFADWSIPLGQPQGPYETRNGIYFRRFEQGMVLVAPDDGLGGTFALDASMYSPEGETYTGKIKLSPGRALLLLRERPLQVDRPRPIELRSLAQWNAASWISERNGELGYLSLEAIMRPARIGEHDLLLSNVRYLEPLTTLRLKIRGGNEKARLLAVAEVNDSVRVIQQIVVAVTADGSNLSVGRDALPEFRMPRRKNAPLVPYVQGAHFEIGSWREVELTLWQVPADRFTFRGWRYLRLEGPLDIASMSLQ